MPFWPGTGIPQGISPFALSAGAAEAVRTVRVISSLAGFDGSPSEVGVASGRVVFLVGRGVG